jgi:hypothetical protein
MGPLFLAEWATLGDLRFATKGSTSKIKPTNIKLGAFGFSDNNPPA